ncbi:MAG: hypothetical protein RIF41_05810 [Polyangiaceae bacterium]
MGCSIVLRSALIGLCLAGSGCQAAPSPGGPAASDPVGPPRLFPAELHTGFDGMAAFRVPAVVLDARGPVTWSVSDPSVATLEVDGAEVMVVSKDTGTATLRAEVDGEILAAELYVALYDAALAPLGVEIYAESCASCHVAEDGPDHTPSEIGQHADSVLATMIYAGLDPLGNEWPDHRWSLEGDAMRAMLRHIRQLEPRGMPSPGE